MNLKTKVFTLSSMLLLAGVLSACSPLQIKKQLQLPIRRLHPPARIQSQIRLDIKSTFQTHLNESSAVT